MENTLIPKTKRRRGENRGGLTGRFDGESLDAIVLNQEAENVLDFVVVDVVRFG